MIVVYAKVKENIKRVCSKCKKRGVVLESCSDCNGQGVVSDSWTETIRVALEELDKVSPLDFVLRDKRDLIFPQDTVDLCVWKVVCFKEKVTLLKVCPSCLNAHNVFLKENKGQHEDQGVIVNPYCKECNGWGTVPYVGNGMSRYKVREVFLTASVTKTRPTDDGVFEYRFTVDYDCFLDVESAVKRCDELNRKELLNTLNISRLP